jgi:CHAD domain-containing protein
VARDADVLLERLSSHAQRLPGASRDGTARVIDAVARRRSESHEALIVALSNNWYLDLIDQLIDAARSPALVRAKADRPGAEALPVIVRHAWRPLAKKVDRLGANPTDEDLHAVRILAKRCRYAAESSAALLGKRTHKLAVATRELQDVLGELNDAVVAEAWLRDWASHSRSGEAAFAAGELAGLQREAASRARRQWPKAWKHVRAAAP